MNISALPGYELIDDQLIRRYTAELKKVKVTGDLAKFINRWRGIWECTDKEGKVSTLALTILSDSIQTDDDALYEALHCIRLSFRKHKGEIGAPCHHMKKGEACVGLEIRMPWALTEACLVGQEYGVPIMTAMHQLFCKDKEHHCCF